MVYKQLLSSRLEKPCRKPTDLTKMKEKEDIANEKCLYFHLGLYFYITIE